MTSVPTQGAYSRATPTTDGSVPSSGISRSAGPFSAAPATMGETATTRARRAGSASRTPGTASSGPMETTGFDGHTTIVSASSERLHDPRRRAGRRGALEAHAAHRHVVAQADEVVLEADLGPGRAQGARLGQRDAGAQRVVGHRQQAHRDAAPLARAPPSPRSAARRRAAGRCGRGAWPGRGRPAGTSPRRRAGPARP